MNISKTKKRWGLILLLPAVIAILALYPLPPQAPIQYYERQSGLLKTEKVAGEKWLVWLYNNPVGEATLWALVKRKVVSHFVIACCYHTGFISLAATSSRPILRQAKRLVKNGKSGWRKVVGVAV